jgi:hypothetical protein
MKPLGAEFVTVLAMPCGEENLAFASFRSKMTDNAGRLPGANRQIPTNTSVEVFAGERKISGQ